MGRGNGTASTGGQQVESGWQPAAAAAGIQAEPWEQAAAPLAGTHVTSPAAGGAAPPRTNISSMDWLRHRSKVRSARQLDSFLLQKAARSMWLLIPRIAKRSTACRKQQW